jgi:hypothetical protein
MPTFSLPEKQLPFVKIEKGNEEVLFCVKQSGKMGEKFQLDYFELITCIFGFGLVMEHLTQEEIVWQRIKQ